METKKRTRIKSQWPIPDDWDGESWCSIVLCVPDSLMWRVVVSGQIYELTRGRNWDANTGVIVDAQAVGKEIFESVDMNCTELTRIADGIEALCDKVPDPISLQDFLGDMIANRDGPTPVEGVSNWIDLFLRLNELYGLVPNIDIRVDPAQLSRLALEGFSAYNTAKFRSETLQLQKAALLKQGGPDVGGILQEIINVIPLGNLVDTFTDIDETVLTIAQSVIDLITGNYVTNRLAEIRDKIDDGNSLLQVLADMDIDTSDIVEAINNSGVDLTAVSDAISNFDLTAVSDAISNLDLNVAVDCDNGDCEDMTTIINNYGCGCGDKQTTAIPSGPPTNITNPSPVDGPVNQVPPPGFSTWNDYVDYKCRASHHIYGQINDVVIGMDGWATALLTGGISDVINAITAISYYWMTSETLTSFVGNLFSWVTAADSPPTFWSQYANAIQSAKDLLVCSMFEASDASTAIADVTDSLSDIAETTLSGFGLTTGSGTGAIVVSTMVSLVTSSLTNDLFQLSDNIPDEAKTCDCASQPPANTGVCYSMNTVGGLGTAQLLSDDGSLQVWRVTPAFDTGVYKLDLKAYDQSNGQIPYQVTAVAETSTPSGGFDLIEYNLEDGSQVGAFQAGCMDNIRYEDTSPGWSLDVTVDLVSMDNCNGCTELPPPIGNCIPFMDTGTGTVQWDGTPFTVTSVNLPGDAELVSITNDRTDPACTDQRFYVEFLSFSISPPTNRVSKIFDYVGGGVTETQYDDVWPPLNTPLTTVSFDMRASGQFQVTMRIYGVDPSS